MIKLARETGIGVELQQEAEYVRQLQA